MVAAISAGVAGLLDLLGRETWEDRIRPGAYTSPKTNTRIVFQFEDVSRKTPISGTMFAFPGVNNAYVQRTGFGSREYPLRCFFSGANHDKVATAFEAAVLEPGTGRLEHPLYGRIPVVPFGEITRNDALKTAANQTIIELSFFTTTGEIYPSSKPSGVNEIVAAIDGFDVAAAQQFDSAMDLVSAINKAASKATFRSYLLKVSSALKSASDSVASVNRAFRDLQSSINLGMDVLIGQPLLLARQCSDLIKAPARALAGIESRLDGYARLADSIFGDRTSQPSLRLTSGASLTERRDRITNDLHTSDLFAANAVAGSILSTTVAGSFLTRPQAVAAAVAIQEQFDAFVEWRDAGLSAVGELPEISTKQTDPGGSLQALQAAAALAVGFLVQTSFGLVPERAIVLDRPRTIIDLCAELYGTTSNEKLDLLISSNDLTGDEILELPFGTKISYFPDSV
jgi:hypothetical protein